LVFGEPGIELGYGRGFPVTASPQMETFTQPALIAFPKTPELEKLGAWELVTDALLKAPF